MCRGAPRRQAGCGRSGINTHIGGKSSAYHTCSATMRARPGVGTLLARFWSNSGPIGSQVVASQRLSIRFLGTGFEIPVLTGYSRKERVKGHRPYRDFERAK